MGKLKRLSGRDVRRILERHDFVCVRQRGSHMVLQRRREDGGTVTVPLRDRKQPKTGTLRGIIEQSGLPRSLFETG